MMLRLFSTVLTVGTAVHTALETVDSPRGADSWSQVSDTPEYSFVQSTVLKMEKYPSTEFGLTLPSRVLWLCQQGKLGRWPAESAEPGEKIIVDVRGYKFEMYFQTGTDRKDERSLRPSFKYVAESCPAPRRLFMNINQIMVGRKDGEKFYAWNKGIDLSQAFDKPFELAGYENRCIEYTDLDDITFNFKFDLTVMDELERIPE